MSANIAPAAVSDFYLFESLDATQLVQVCQSARRIELKNGEHLFEQMDAAERFYCLASGQVTLKRFSPEGDEKIIEIILPGQSFAEALMFVGKPRYPVTAVSVGRSEVFSFSNRDYLAILRESNETCLKLMGAMSMRLRYMVNEIDRLTLQNAASRIAGYLLYQIPSGAQQPFKFSLNTPKNMIASFLSIKPETLSRTLQELSQQGLLAVQGKDVTLMDLPALRKLAGMSLESELDDR